MTSPDCDHQDQQPNAIQETVRVPPYVPTSAALARLLDEAPTDRVSLGWLISRLQKRSFGLVMLLLALLGMAPGIATVAGVLLVFPAAQMIMGRESPSFPRFIAGRSIPTRHFIRWAATAIPLLARMETIIRPRWRTPFQATKRGVGILVLILAATLIWPIPFSHIIPMLVIILISFAYLEEDGLLLCISLVAAAVSIAVTTAIVWAALQASGLLESLLLGA
jgi:hypothetical protein